METIMNTREVKEILTIMKDLKLGKNNLSILSAVRVQGKDHKIFISGTNLKTSIIATLANYDFITFDFCLYHDSFLKAVSSLETDTFNLQYENDKCALVSSDTLETYNIESLKSENYPDIFRTNVNDSCIEVSSVDIQQTLKNCLPCISTDETRYFLNGVFFENDVSNKDIKLVATDGRRLNYNRIDTWTDEKEFKDSIVHPGGLKIYSKLKNLQGYSKLFFNNTMNIVCDYSTYKLEIQNQIIEGKFPMYQRIVNDRAADNQITLDVKNFLKVAKKVKKFVDQRSKRSFLNIDSGNNIFLAADDEKISINLGKDHRVFELNVALNIDYIIDVLSTTTNNDLNIYLNDGKIPVYFNHDNGFTMIQPMKLD